MTVLTFPRLAAATVVIATTAVVLIWQPDPSAAAMWIGENGVIESISALSWIVAVLVCLAGGFTDRSARVEWLLGAGVLGLAALREFDIQKRLTDWNVGHLPNYTSAEIPLTERAVVLAFFVVPSALIVSALIYRMAGRFLAAWKSPAHWPRDVVIWIAMIVISAPLDKFHKLKPLLGIESSSRLISTTMEESLELSLGIYVVLVLWSAWRAAIARTAAGGMRAHE